MHHRELALASLVAALLLSGLAAALLLRAPRGSPAPLAPSQPLPTAAPEPVAPPPASAEAHDASRSERPALHIRNINTLEEDTVRLHDAHGQLDEEAAAKLDRLLADGRRAGREPVSARIDRRLLRLLFHVAYRFEATEVELVSGYRRPGRSAEGFHGKGKAVDFRLIGREAPDVAAYARTLPRVGVGIYTHPRTRWVHIDVRPQSYHWVDATGPGKRWGDVRLPMDQRALDAQDASDPDDRRLDAYPVPRPAPSSAVGP